MDDDDDDDTIFLQIRYNGESQTCIALNNIPNIIEHNYKEYKFRLSMVDLNHVFRSNYMDIIKIVNNYPQKSSVSINEYYSYGHTDLRRLNYKYKMAFLFELYFVPFCTILCILFGYMINVLCNYEILQISLIVIPGFIYPHVCKRIYIHFGSRKLPL